MQTILIVLLILSLIQSAFLIVALFRIEKAAGKNMLIAKEVINFIGNRFGRERRKKKVAAVIDGAESVLNPEPKEQEVVINGTVHEH
jgi:hypothetical protein